MKYLSIILPIICLLQYVTAQELPPVIEQKLELTVEADEFETEDDTYLQHLEYWKKYSLNLNAATENDLQQLRLLTPLQISFFMQYRKMLGDLFSIYELQAIPGWDLMTIKKILPFVTVMASGKSFEPLNNRFRNGEHQVLSRISHVLEKSDGFTNNNGSFYEGSRPHIMMRYRYRYKNNLQYGLVADKDAGESFFSSSQKRGFDFYSLHFFATGVGKIKALAIGDYAVNLGQGLIHWQSLAFKKSADVLNIKRQSAIFRPYASAGEYYFNRGVGITLQHKHLETSMFISLRNHSASHHFDTILQQDVITSIATSGYHRTPTEIRNKNQINQLSYGGNIRYQKNNFTAGINAVHYAFSKNIQKRNESYNKYAIAGKNWSNYSVDYSYTYRNMHFFGEAAIDINLNKAFLNGLLISIDKRVDLALLHRHISKAYQSVNGNAFTENTLPGNENGLYASISLRLTPVIKIDLYADMFAFPWLRYLVDAPSKGKEFLVQVSFTPARNLEIYTRFKTESKQGNTSGNITVTNTLADITKHQWRIHTIYKLSKDVTLRQRVELSWYKNATVTEQGFLTYVDFIYKSMMKKYGAGVRLQFFETGGYNSRIYAYENDVLYNFSIPPFFGKGFRYYLNFNYDILKRATFYVKIAQTNYPGQLFIGSGNDRILDQNKTEIKFQGIVRF